MKAATAVRESSEGRQEIHRVIDATSIEDHLLLRNIRKAAQLQEEVAAYEFRIKRVRDEIISAALEAGDLGEEGSVIYLVDGILCKVSSGYDYRILPERREFLRQALAHQYDHLVEEVVELRPTKQLIEMACDGDILEEEIRQCLTIRLRAPEVAISQANPADFVSAGAGI